VERSYADQHIRHCDSLYDQKEYYALLLNLIGLVEDAETLRYDEQSEFVRKTLYFRDHLRNLLTSPEFRAFEAGELPVDSIFRVMEQLLHSDLNVGVRLDTLPPPRDFLKLDNYIDRIEWQKYKSRSDKDAFLQLLLFAQYDRRYLRAVSMTSRKHSDLVLDNHNLPMILLFREALHICGGNKKAAVDFSTRPCGSRLPGSRAFRETNCRHRLRWRTSFCRAIWKMVPTRAAIGMCLAGSPSIGHRRNLSCWPFRERSLI